MSDKTELDYDELDKEIQNQIGTQLEELEGLEIDRKEIGNPKKLTESISQIVWEQFILQIAGQAGSDFIKNNHDLNLSLKKADHYLDSDKFVNGEIPKHNFENAEKYRNRQDTWKTNFKNNNPSNGIVRDAFDENRAKGSASVAKDHIIPVAEILRDKEMTTFVDQADKVKFANDTNVNLKDLDSAANSSKGDRPMKEWLDSERNGQKPEDRFNIDREELEKRDDYARQKEKELIDEKKAISEQEGKNSINAEIRRSVSVTTQAIAVALFAKLTRTVFQELIRWLGEKDRKVKTFFAHLKKAISDFIKDFKNNVLLSIDVGVTVILTQIYGEIIPMIRKALLFLKIGGKTLIDVSRYLKDPNNKGKETSIVVMDIGKIVTIGLTTAGGIALGAAITAALIYYVPALGVQIPLLGSPAGLLGIFFGGLTAGICGAIVLKNIDGALANRMLSENIAKQMLIQSNVISLQDSQFSLYDDMVESAKVNSSNSIKKTMLEGVEEMKKSKESLKEERKSENDSNFKKISSMIDDIE